MARVRTLQRNTRRRLELASAVGFVDGCKSYLPTGEYFRPDVMRMLVQDLDGRGNFDLSDERLEQYPGAGFDGSKGRVTRLFYYWASQDERGADPDLSLSFREFVRLGRPLVLIRKRRDTYKTKG